MNVIELALEELKKENNNFKLNDNGDIVFDLEEEALFYPEAIYMFYIIQKYNLIFLIRKNSILIHRR